MGTMSRDLGTMNDSQSRMETSHEPAARTYEFWRPVISPQYLDRVQALHRDLIAELAPALAERTGRAARWRLVELEFKDLGGYLCELAADDYVALLGCDRMRHAGVLAFSGSLASAVVRHGLNLSPDFPVGALTAIEMNVLRRAVGGLAEAVFTRYEQAGLPRLAIERQGDAHVLAESLSVSRELVVFRFEADQSMGWWLLLALDADPVLRLAEGISRDNPTGAEVQVEDLGAIVLRGRITLHRFKAPVEMLCRLRPGDRLLLPDPDEAWLSVAEGSELMPIRVDIDLGAHRAVCIVREGGVGE